MGSQLHGVLWMILNLLIHRRSPCEWNHNHLFRFHFLFQLFNKIFKRRVTSFYFGFWYGHRYGIKKWSVHFILWSDLWLFLRFASLTLWLQSEYWLNNLVNDFILWTWPAIKNHKTSLVSKSLVITKAVKILPSCQWRWTTWFTSVKRLRIVRCAFWVQIPRPVTTYYMTHINYMSHIIWRIGY